MPEVTVNHKSYPEDEEFELPGLGVFKNGVAKEVNSGNIQGWINAGFPWPSEDVEANVTIALPPEPVESPQEEAADSESEQPLSVEEARAKAKSDLEAAFEGDEEKENN